MAGETDISISSIGLLEYNVEDEDFVSRPIYVPALKRKCRFRFSYIDAARADEISEVLGNFLGLSPDFMSSEVAPYVLEYRNDFIDVTDAEVDEIQNNVWEQVSFPEYINVGTVSDENSPYYVDLNCECDWEIEHGLQICFTNGNLLTRIGGCSGHANNSRAYGREDFDNKIYVSSSDLQNMSKSVADVVRKEKKKGLLSWLIN